MMWLERYNCLICVVSLNSNENRGAFRGGEFFIHKTQTPFVLALLQATVEHPQTARCDSLFTTNTQQNTGALAVFV